MYTFAVIIFFLWGILYKGFISGRGWGWGGGDGDPALFFREGYMLGRGSIIYATTLVRAFINISKLRCPNENMNLKIVR